MVMNEMSSDAKRRVLKDVFGFDEFRPGQERVVDALLAGRNVLTVMPTGSGKSLCYQLPAMVCGGLTVVVSPLLALMQDQVSALHLAGVAAEAINSSKSRAENVASWRRVTAGEVRLLYMAPERLMTEPMLKALAKVDLRLIAIDEAHCISQWGPSFRPEYEALSRLPDLFARVPIIALTATADATTRADISARLFAGRAEQIVLGFDRPNIRLTVEPKQHGDRQLLAFLKLHSGQSGIVYCLSRKKTEETARFLVTNGFRALPYHAGMTQQQREANQNRFMTEPAVVMVATIAFGMGIDKPDVRFVFHSDLPGSMEAYYQEIGRGGRDGEPAEAHMLFGLDDMRMRRRFIEEENSNEERKRREHQRLDGLLGYCETAACRRQVLLSWFGEKIEPCGNCDNCLNPAAVVDRSDDARAILTAVRRTGERYGAAHILEILQGVQDDFRDGEVAPTAPFAGRAPKELRALIRQLTAGGFLDVEITRYGGLKLSAKGHALLRSDVSFHFRAAQRRATKKEARQRLAAELPSAEASLLDALKQLRLALAKQRRVAAYLIFSDRTLIEMAQRRPRDIDEFAEISGVGARKLEEFAAPFLSAIRKYRAGDSV